MYIVMFLGSSSVDNKIRHEKLFFSLRKVKLS